MKFTILFVLFFINSLIYAQNIQYARAIVDTLCSSYFDGRGYYNNGENRAAEFIKSEYKKIGLQSVNNNYFQHFKFATSSIKGDLLLQLENTILQPGIDYLIAPSSPSYSKESKVIYLKKSELIDIEIFKETIPLFRNKFVVIDQSLVKNESNKVKNLVREIICFLKFSPDIELNGVIELIEGKLTFSASQLKAMRPHIIILKNKVSHLFKKIILKTENQFDTNYQSQNIIGYIEGEIKDKYIYVTGHYDHLGRMGDSVYFPGANDNASGIAMLLTLAKEFSSEKKPKYTLVFICFGSEEIGLVGSKYYTENPLLPLKNIQFLINLDILGTGDDGIQVVNGKVHKKDFDYLVNTNNSKNLLKQVKIRGKACNSDHCFFSEKGVPSFFIYTLGGIAHYHNIYDKSETLPLTEYEDLFVLLKDFIVNKK